MEQVEDSISGLEDKIVIKQQQQQKKKTEGFLEDSRVPKEYARNLYLHQNTKLANHGHQRRRRCASQRYK
jgi:hypothetical protein